MYFGNICFSLNCVFNLQWLITLKLYYNTIRFTQNKKHKKLSLLLCKFIKCFEFWWILETDFYPFPLHSQRQSTIIWIYNDTFFACSISLYFHCRYKFCNFATLRMKEVCLTAVVNASVLAYILIADINFVIFLL